MRRERSSAHRPCGRVGSSGRPAGVEDRYVLGMNPVTLLGARSGAGTHTAALRAIRDEAESKPPALGRTVPCAVGNILLRAWGPVLVALPS